MRRGRALAVVGLWLAGQATYDGLPRGAGAGAEDRRRVLDVQAGEIAGVLHFFVAVDDAQTCPLSPFKGLRVRCRQNF